MISFPNAKINLGLDIIEKRNDGYHTISSCFYPIPLSDILEIIESDKFSFFMSGLSIAGNEKENLVVKAYNLLKNDFDIPPVSIHLHKIIPLETGLGGGSSDAAFTLKALNNQFELFLDDSLLTDYALKLGSDCPFFISNEPAIAQGRGEILSKVKPLLSSYYIYLVKPDFSISTKEAYQGIIPLLPEIPIEKILEDYPVEDWKELLKNDFEITISRKKPAILEIKEILYEEGALYSSVTGSGSGIYGLFKSEPIRSSRFPKNYYQWIGRL